MVLICLLLLAPLSFAQKLYPFDDVIKAQRFDRVLRDLRCMVCQNEDIAHSSSKLAEDLRHHIYQMVQEGQSAHQITVSMVKQYGDFVLFKPPLVKRTYVLWYGPVILLLIAFAVVSVVVYQYRERSG